VMAADTTVMIEEGIGIDQDHQLRNVESYNLHLSHGM